MTTVTRDDLDATDGRGLHIADDNDASRERAKARVKRYRQAQAEWAKCKALGLPQYNDVLVARAAGRKNVPATPAWDAIHNKEQILMATNGNSGGGARAQHDDDTVAAWVAEAVLNGHVKHGSVVRYVREHGHSASHSRMGEQLDRIRGGYVPKGVDGAALKAALAGPTKADAPATTKSSKATTPRKATRKTSTTQVTPRPKAARKPASSKATPQRKATPAKA